MSKRTILSAIVTTLVLIGIVAFDYLSATSAVKRKKEWTYPQPSYVYFPDDISDEEMMMLARYQVRELNSNWGSLGNIEPGKKGLITHRSTLDGHPQDMRVLKILKKAVQERGADVDYIHTGDLLEMNGYPREWADERERAADVIDPEFAPLISEIASRFMLASGQGVLEILSPQLIQKISDVGAGSAKQLLPHQQMVFATKVEVLKKYLENHPGYDYLFLDFGRGGTILKRLKEVFGDKYQSAWRIVSADKMARGAFMPDEIVDVTEEKILGIIPWIEHVRVEDPEGTHLEFSVTPEEVKLWRMGAYTPGTVLMYPTQATRFLYKQKGIKAVANPDANGVIAGTMGHEYYFPRVELKVEHGVVTEVRGEGLMADVMREMQTRFKDLQFPYFPRKGWFQVFQLSLMLNPMVGGVHVDFGFGPEVRIPEIEEYGEKHGVPVTHELHINQAFLTYEATVAGGKKVMIAENGNLVMNDDPEVRAIASKYGDPDDLLRPQNKRPIPGINFPGSYAEYAKHPFPFNKRYQKETTDLSWPHMVRGKPLQLRELGR